MFRARNALFFPRKIHDKSGPVNAFYAGFGRLAELSEKPGALDALLLLHSFTRWDAHYSEMFTETLLKMRDVSGVQNYGPFKSRLESRSGSEAPDAPPRGKGGI